jgi:hypothetical protein
MSVSGKQWRAVAGAFWVAQVFALAQTAVDLRTQTKNVDFSAAAATKPNKSGAALPVVCGVGETFFLTTAPAGQNLYGCAVANTWSLVGSAALPPSDTPGQFLVWNGTSWQARSGLGATLSLSFSAVADGTCADQAGALPYQWAAGSPVVLTPPAQYCDPVAGVCSAPAGWVASARVSAAGVATVRMCNFSGAAQTLPPANYTLAQYADHTTTVTIAFPALADGTCSTQTVTAQGVTAASALALGLPAAIESGLMVAAAPAGTNSVVVTGCNWSGATLTPAAASYQISVI